MKQSFRPSVVSRTFPARFDSLAAICDFVTQRAQVAGLGPRAVYAVQVAVDEACSNIIEHAYGGQERGTIECTCSTKHDRLIIQLHDHGRPFDLDTVPKPDLQADLHERHAGGLGVFFIQQLMDAVQFESIPGKGNTLTLTKCRTSPSSPPSSPRSKPGCP